MTNINKCYLDIEVKYRGKLIGQDNLMFRDWENWTFDEGGVIGALFLDIDKERKEIKNTNLKQILIDKDDELTTNKYMVDIINDIGNADMIVTWGGRGFDLPILVERIAYKKDEEKMDLLNKFYSKDRDLIDLCFDRNLKGNLFSIARRLKILDGTNKGSLNIDLIIAKENRVFDDRVIDPSDNTRQMMIDCLDDCYEIKKLDVIKKRNEFDVRVLPLIEDKLGLLYNGQESKDRYHHIFDSTENIEKYIQKFILKARGIEYYG